MSTVDDMRDRLATVLEKATARGTVTCPMCNGEGTVERAVRAITQADVAQAIGTGRTSITNFLGGRQTFTLPVGLRLLAWLDEHEANYGAAGSGEAGSKS